MGSSSRYFCGLITVIIQLMMGVSLFAQLQAPPNLIYISFDGTSRQTLYGLLEKQKLPGLASVIARGNIRNLDIVTHPTTPMASYMSLFTGYYHELQTGADGKFPDVCPKNVSVFERLQEQIPSADVSVYLQGFNDHPSTPNLPYFFNEALSGTQFHSIESGTSRRDITAQIVSFIQQQTTPFILFVNLTGADYVARRYREGCQLYSTEIQGYDRFLRSAIVALKNKRIWENTHVVVSTSYGFYPGTNRHDNVKESFIAATFPIRYKGTQMDIVPTLFRLYKMPWQSFEPKLPGKPLIY